MKILTLIVLALTLSFFLLAPPNHPLRLIIREVPAVTDHTGEEVVENGQVQYESWVRVLPREPYRYRPVTEFRIFDRMYVVASTNPDYFRETRSVIFTVNIGLLVFFSCLLLPVTVFSVGKRIYSNFRN